VKLLLLGANGQVGHALRAALAPLGELVAATRDGQLDDGSACLAADLADTGSLAQALKAAGADVVVNAAAYTAVDRAEDEPECADRINHRALAEIGAWADARGAGVVHYSTDYVFDGHATRPYREDDPTAPLGVYGASKLAGERALAASGARHLILRTAWVYAARGHNFLRTMLRLAHERDELRVVADQLGAPTPAPLIAAATARMVHAWAGGAGAVTESGIFHLTAGGQCSWHAFASAIVARALANGLIAREPAVTPITTADFPTRARRPAYSVLDCTRIGHRFALDLPSWQEGLDAVIGELAR
jgi:dTDP-4-dehydrorhamnose reductase